MGTLQQLYGLDVDVEPTYIEHVTQLDSEPLLNECIRQRLHKKELFTAWRKEREKNQGLTKRVANLEATLEHYRQIVTGMTNNA